jgi:NAD(P)-dependent dehydrogenase (short-subunit alcohol dehydrogenase family)
LPHPFPKSCWLGSTKSSPIFDTKSTGQPDDIGGGVAFLCTEEARWVNAQRLEASGGMFT